jgi:hypothetical protein
MIIVITTKEIKVNIPSINFSFKYLKNKRSLKFLEKHLTNDGYHLVKITSNCTNKTVNLYYES